MSNQRNGSCWMHHQHMQRRYGVRLRRIAFTKSNGGLKATMARCCCVNTLARMQPRNVGLASDAGPSAGYSVAWPAVGASRSIPSPGVMSDLPNEKTIALIDAQFNALMRRRKANVTGQMSLDR